MRICLLHDSYATPTATQVHSIIEKSDGEIKGEQKAGLCGKTPDLSG